MESSTLPRHFLQHEEGQNVITYGRSELHLDRETPVHQYQEWTEDDGKATSGPKATTAVVGGSNGLVLESFIDVGEPYYESEYPTTFDESHELHEETEHQFDASGHPEGTEGFVRYRKPNSTRRVTIVECEFCGVIIKHPSKIQAHMRTHTGEKPFECDICGMRFTQKTPMINHYRKHVGDTPFVCGFGCGKKFVSNARKNAHELRHRGMKRQGGARPHLKPTKRRFVSVERKQKRLDVLPISHDDRPEEEPSAVVDWPPPYGEIEQPISALSHKRLDEVIEAVASGITLPSRRQESIKPAVIAQCHICGIMLRHPSKIQAHMRTHTGEKPYSCEDCGMKFCNLYSLRMHIKRKHSVNGRNIPCTWECGMKFVSAGAKNEHERIVHAGIKRYECTIPGCRQMFTRRNYLMMHRLKEHDIYEPVFDPNEIAESEEADSNRNMQHLASNEYVTVREMTLDPVTNRVVEVSQNGVLTFSEDAQFEQEEFTEEEEDHNPIGHNDEAVHTLHNLDSGCLENSHHVSTVEKMSQYPVDSSMDKVEMSNELDEIEHAKHDMKYMEETVKHIWMKSDRSEPRRRVSVRILKRNV